MPTPLCPECGSEMSGDAAQLSCGHCGFMDRNPTADATNLPDICRNPACLHALGSEHDEIGCTVPDCLCTEQQQVVVNAKGALPNAVKTMPCKCSHPIKDHPSGRGSDVYCAGSSGGPSEPRENAGMSKCAGCGEPLDAANVWDSYNTGKKWCKACDSTKASEQAAVENAGDDEMISEAGKIITGGHAGPIAARAEFKRAHPEHADDRIAHFVSSAYRRMGMDPAEMENASGDICTICGAAGAKFQPGQSFPVLACDRCAKEHVNSGAGGENPPAASTFTFVAPDGTRIEVPALDAKDAELQLEREMIALQTGIDPKLCTLENAGEGNKAYDFIKENIHMFEDLPFDRAQSKLVAAGFPGFAAHDAMAAACREGLVGKEQTTHGMERKNADRFEHVCPQCDGSAYVEDGAGNESKRPKCQGKGFEVVNADHPESGPCAVCGHPGSDHSGKECCWTGGKEGQRCGFAAHAYASKEKKNAEDVGGTKPQFQKDLSKENSSCHKCGGNLGEKEKTYCGKCMKGMLSENAASRNPDCPICDRKGVTEPHNVKTAGGKDTCEHCGHVYPAAGNVPEEQRHNAVSKEQAVGILKWVADEAIKPVSVNMETGETVTVEELERIAGTGQRPEHRNSLRAPVELISERNRHFTISDSVSMSDATAAGLALFGGTPR